ncbi:MAG TPA: hypothetical protein PKU97_24165, partial [Kofleriaceae bacterium]|nr:hypothetical protein [Kofleriaceae bacterium]
MSLACSAPARPAAKPSGAPEPAAGTGSAPGDGRAHLPTVPGELGAPGKPRASLLDPRGAACVAAPCTYHAGTDGFFACLAGGSGACFHFGAPCQPADDCMLDGSDRRYKRCTQVVDGRCQRFAAPCAPPGTCWMHPDDGLYRECTQRQAGACARWGELCDPTMPAKIP